MHRAVLLLLTVVIATACTETTRAPPRDPPPPLPPRVALVVLPVGGEHAAPADVPVVRAEVVSSRADRNRGLMGRDDLPTDGGMLFVYASSREREFWMKDCLLALDLAFLDVHGTVLHLATLAPLPGAMGTEVPRTRCDGPVQFVLETHAGWLASHQVEVGDRVDVSAATLGVAADE